MAKSDATTLAGDLSPDALTPTPITGAAYERLLSLAEGGMGRVELSVRRGGRFQRLYALKRLQPAIRDNPDAKTMFIEEGRLAGLIQHPNVVGVLDVGEDHDGPFLAMEYIDGVTARDVLQAARREDLLVPVQICCQIAAQAARGLAEAHGLTAHDGRPLDLVHRDVSPHNLLIGFDGTVRVADFGIARAIGRDHQTSTGILKGKLGYMAPEVLRFEKADTRTDLFALGVVLYELLAGARLYGGRDDAQRARRILHDPPPDIGEVRTDVPAALQVLLLSLLSKERDDRPADADEIAGRLEAIVHDQVQEEGAYPLRDFVAEGFSLEREERQKEIQEALDGLAHAPVSAALTPARSSTRSPRWGRGLAMAGAMAGVSVAVVWAVQGSAAPPLPEPASTSAADAPPAAGPPSTGLPSAGLPSAGPPSAGPPSAGPFAAVLAAATVAIEVRTTPPGAEVEVAGLAPVRSPAVLAVPRADAPVRLAVRLGGYVVRADTIVPDANQRLEIVLEPIPRGRPDRPRRPRRLSAVPEPPREPTPQAESGPRGESEPRGEPESRGEPEPQGEPESTSALETLW